MESLKKEFGTMLYRAVVSNLQLLIIKLKDMKEASKQFYDTEVGEYIYLTKELNKTVKEHKEELEVLLNKFVEYVGEDEEVKRDFLILTDYHSKSIKYKIPAEDIEEFDVKIKMVIEDLQIELEDKINKLNSYLNLILLNRSIIKEIIDIMSKISKESEELNKRFEELDKIEEF